MNTRNYTKDDLQVLDVLSDQCFLCFSMENTWQLVWKSQRLSQEDIKDSDLIGKMKRVYENRDTYLILFDAKRKEMWYRVSFENIIFEDMPCMLFRLTFINDVVKDHKIEHINRSRTDNIPCGIFCIHVDHDTLHCIYNNTYFYQTLGYEEHELEMDDMLTTKIIYPQDYPGFMKEVLRNKEEGTSLFELEYRIMKKDGSLLWVIARVVPDILEDHFLAVVMDNTQRRESVNQLRISEEEKKIALQQGNLMILRYDVKTKTLYLTDEGAFVSEKYRVISDVPDIVIGKHMISEETMQEFMGFFHDMHKGIPQGSAVFKQMMFPQREYRWIQARYTMLYNEKQEPETAIISYKDYTEFHEKEMAYEKWRVEFDRKKEGSLAYYEYDLTHDKFEALEGKLNDSLPQAVRKSFTYIAHYAANELVSKQDRKKYLKVLSREYLLAQYEKGRQIITLKHRRLNEDGQEYWALAEVRMVLDPYTSILKASVLLYDIDHEMKRNIELRKLSQTDSLTGLYNRTSLFRSMENTLKHSGMKVMHMMILIDIDHFKELNDTYGHQYGDACLVKVAQAMKYVCRSEDVCSRIGGDEFVIFIRNLPLHADIEKILEDIKQVITAPDDDGRRLSASIGVSCYPRDGMDIETLYHNADQAMYEAKRQGRNQWHLFCQKK